MSTSKLVRTLESTLSVGEPEMGKYPPGGDHTSEGSLALPSTADTPAEKPEGGGRPIHLSPPPA